MGHTSKYRLLKSTKKIPQKLIQLSPRSLPRHLVGKRTAQKDAIKAITSDSQVNSYFPYRWSPASLTINIYFYLFLYLYITRKTINNGTPHLKSLKSQNRRAALGRPAIKLLGGFNYSRHSLSRSRRDPLKHFEISVLRHIRCAELRKIPNEQPNFTNKHVI